MHTPQAMHTPEESFRFLRVQVQHELALPSVIVVGAALRGDGTTYVACGLASAFAEAGHETLLLDANPRNSGIAEGLGIMTVADASKPESVDRNLSVASLYEGEERIVADDELAEIVAGVRSRYGVTIVDAPVIPRSGAALQLAQVADGVLVAVRLGRRPCAADEEMKLLLQAGGLLSGKAVSGIVPTRAVKRRTPHPKAVPMSMPVLPDVIRPLVARFQTMTR